MRKHEITHWALVYALFGCAIGCGGGGAAGSTDAGPPAPDGGSPPGEWISGDHAADSGTESPDGAPDAPVAIDVVVPMGLVVDRSGNLFVAEESLSSESPGGLLKINLATDTAVLIPGSDTNNGLQPTYMTGDRARTLYLTTGHGHSVLQVDTETGAVTTLAGGHEGVADGIGTAAQFVTPAGIVYDGRGALYVADFESHTIRKIVVATGTVTTVAGMSLAAGYVEATGAAARFNGPRDITYDPSTDLVYVADTGNGAVRLIDPTSGAVTTVAGNGHPGSLSDGTGTSAEFDVVGAMAADGHGNLYVADRATIRKIDLASGAVAVFVGVPGVSVSRDGTAATARLANTDDMLLDDGEALYFSSCQTVRRLDLATRTVVTLYGVPDVAHAALLGCVTRGHALHAP